MESMFEILMALPLFRGVSRERIAKTVGHVKFHFLKYPGGEKIISAGDPCTHLKFIISGQVRATVENHNGRFAVSQTLTAPDVLAPDFLFGKFTSYPCTVIASGTTGILQITKADYMKILNTDQVFMFNYLNLLSMNAQKSIHGVLGLTTGSMEERIAFWVIALTQPSGTDIVLRARQRDLYSFFGVQRSAFMAVLENMKERGMLDYDSTEVRITDRKKMLNLLLEHPVAADYTFKDEE